MLTISRLSSFFLGIVFKQEFYRKNASWHTLCITPAAIDDRRTQEVSK